MTTSHPARESPYETRFDAMASPCSILLDCHDESLARELSLHAQNETHRIEQAFSRYRDDNVIYRINTANGATIRVDDELAGLLDFASQLFELSHGLFDITSGALRQIWRFKERETPPSQRQIDDVLPYIGWQRVKWQKPFLQLLPKMEIDLGGIGKEYAVDRVFELIARQFDGAFLVNFGGDLRARGPKRNGEIWHVGVERPDCDNEALTHIPLQTGALTTSGDSRRFINYHGKRYGHILNPLTGYPVQNAPRSVTVLADSAIEAGALSTLAMLQGERAEAFLSENNVKSWCIR